jgi:hypothetical protein
MSQKTAFYECCTCGNVCEIKTNYKNDAPKIPEKCPWKVNNPKFVQVKP